MLTGSIDLTCIFVAGHYGRNVDLHDHILVALDL